MQLRTVIFRVVGAAVLLFRNSSVAFEIRPNINVGTVIQPFLSSFSTTTARDTTISTPTNMTSWIQPRLTALYEVADIDALQSAFGQLFSAECEVLVAHAAQPLQTFKDTLVSRRAFVKNVTATVAWGDVISTNDDKPDQPSVVAGSLVVTRFLPFRVRVTQAQIKTHINFSARIEQDASVEADEQGEQRRITSFYYTSVDKTPPIHFAVPRAANEGGSDE
ncbi:hypothetical protein BS17DRAFT_779687 [Gyrodon lividus]|nr:hypothetical protein BS17DRAFT_779687 [Gyrodon lividus]